MRSSPPARPPPRRRRAPRPWRPSMRPDEWDRFADEYLAPRAQPPAFEPRDWSEGPVSKDLAADVMAGGPMERRAAVDLGLIAMVALTVFALMANHSLALADGDTGLHLA